MWSGDISQMGHLADRIADLASVPARAAKAVSSEIQGFVEEEFAAGEDPYGDSWKSLAEATVARGRFAPPLTDSSDMRGSVQVKPMRGAGISITVPHPAEDHQTGWSGVQGDGPKRMILPDRGELPPAWEEAIESTVDREMRRAVR